MARARASTPSSTHRWTKTLGCHPDPKDGGANLIQDLVVEAEAFCQTEIPNQVRNDNRVGDCVRPISFEGFNRAGMCRIARHTPARAMPTVLALDQGTTSSRALLFDASGHAVASAQQEFTQHFPEPGWVEHDPNEIWQTQLQTARDALAKLEHLVVQDIFLTETANYADVILPASAFAEKSGTVTNTNRQVQMGRPAVTPPGDAKEDWWIEVELAKRLGLGWTYTHPSEVFDEMTKVMKSLNNITWDRLENQNVVMYPSLTPEDPGQPVVFSDGFPREGGRAKFTPASVIAPDETPDEEYPMILTTGRQLEHWHTGSMTRRSKVLDAVEPEANCSLHPSTLRQLGVEPGGLLRLSTRRGSIEIMARADRAVAPDMVFLPFAYVEAAANILTNPAVDPFGKIPEFKFSAVRVEKAGSAVAAE